MRAHLRLARLGLEEDGRCLAQRGDGGGGEEGLVPDELAEADAREGGVPLLGQARLRDTSRTCHGHVTDTFHSSARLARSAAPPATKRDIEDAQEKVIPIE